MSAHDLGVAIASVRERIASAAARVGRDPESITLLVATKGVSVDDIRSGAEEGVTVAGENRVQELLAKQGSLADMEWHLIGPLQRNKVNKVLGRVALIHTVDSLELAAAIGRRAQTLGVAQDILIEVNTSDEETKHGFSPQDATGAANQIAGLSGLHLRGLMTMAAPGDPTSARRCFAALASIRAGADWPAGADHLSMGMSEDFVEAVEEGATIVRVGSAIFGARCEAGLGA